MNKKILFLLSGATLATGLLLSSCTADEPFGEGEGVLKMKMVVNSTLTRAEDDNQQELADKCVVYISGSQGLLYKFQGLDDVPSDIYLKSGGYVAEAWTGDSVSADFEKKFYRAYEPFTISKGSVTNVVLNCKIANVVASINPEPIIADALKNYKVTIGHSRGSLDFTEENAKTAHGYFMMPNSDTDLTWTITGQKEDGSDFTKIGTIPNVQRAHEYVLNIKYTPNNPDAVGGGFITVTIDDKEFLIEDRVELTGAPAIEGVGFDISQPLAGEQGSFSRTSIYVESLGTLSGLTVKTDASMASAMQLPESEFDFILMQAAAREALANKGVTCDYTPGADGANSSAKITFSADALNKLPNGEYTIDVTATDVYGKKRTRTLNIVVSDASVVPQDVDEFDVRSYSAVLRGTILKDEVSNPSFRYRQQGTNDWITVDASNAIKEKPSRKGYSRVAGSSYYAKISGLKPATKYEYQAICDGYTNSTSRYFTTESVFALPNSDFEAWSTGSDKAYIPGAGGTVTFWDSGNHGSITMSVNVTQPTSSPAHGTQAAKLQSQYVGVTLGGIKMGKFAAGNLFAGTYDGTDGTDGILTFGRKFDGSRPVKLRGYVYYHPGKVDYSSTSELAKDQTDIGSIYVALTSQTVEIRTKTSNQSLFDPNASYVLAYGSMDFTQDYGSSSELRQFEITLDYRTASQLVRAPYLVLVCSASKYGDYFTGSTESVMVVDDLELVYE